MVFEHVWDSKHLFSRSFWSIPNFSPGSKKEKSIKVEIWWQWRDRLLSVEVGTISLEKTVMTAECVGMGIFSRKLYKINVRGCKRLGWVSALHESLLSQFERLRSPGVKKNTLFVFDCYGTHHKCNKRFILQPKCKA